MYNHAPPDYDCPFCGVVQGRENTYTGQKDVVYRDEFVTAFVPSHFWVNNKGHVIIVPNEHYENIYDLPDEIGGQIFRASRQMALAFKEVYNCGGVSTRQHNEPGGYQEVWHFHLHVFPRYEGDNFYHTDRYRTTPEERLPYAEKLRQYFHSLT